MSLIFSDLPAGFGVVMHDQMPELVGDVEPLPVSSSSDAPPAEPGVPPVESPVPPVEPAEPLVPPAPVAPLSAPVEDPPAAPVDPAEEPMFAVRSVLMAVIC